jgi:hypothetical protein
MSRGHHGNVSEAPPAPAKVGERLPHDSELKGDDSVAPPSSVPPGNGVLPDPAPERSRSSSGQPQTTPKPLLASEALIEDLAPVEPWAGAVRWWMALAGLGFVLVGLAPLLGGPPQGDVVPAIIIGGMAVAGAIAPLGYVPRAALMLVIGVSIALLAMVSMGPALVVGGSLGGWSALHFVAAAGLSAALLFRARYRAYVGARFFLMMALAAALPLIGYAVVTLGQAALVVQVTTGVALSAIAVSMIGFMGSETTVAGGWVAGAVIVAVCTQLGAETLFGPRVAPDGLPALLYGIASVFAFLCATMLASLGTFMLLAARHWRAARSVELNRPMSEQPDSLTDTWSTRK